MKFKSLLLCQANSLEPQWFQAVSFPTAIYIPLYIDKDSGLLKEEAQDFCAESTLCKLHTWLFSMISCIIEASL